MQWSSFPIIRGLPFLGFFSLCEVLFGDEAAAPTATGELQSEHVYLFCEKSIFYY
jgi:hypothetical protein